jgi:predicted membrane protein
VIIAITVALAAAVFGPWSALAAALLAAFWSSRQPVEPILSWTGREKEP